MKLNFLSEIDREEIAVMIMLWKDFKSHGTVNAGIYTQALKFSDIFGVREEFDKLLSKMPIMEIKPKNRWLKKK